jgi:hypothetical protein
VPLLKGLGCNATPFFASGKFHDVRVGERVIIDFANLLLKWNSMIEEHKQLLEEKMK